MLKKIGNPARKVVMNISLAISLFATLTPPKAEAEPLRDFIMSCSYGVLAGTLVGAATLAFSDKPGDSLNKVARGASFGLYAGILLGLYVVYGVPSQEEAEIRDQLGYEAPKPLDLRLVFAPVVGDRGIEGGQLSYSVYRF
jgi:hypothetical protein